MFSVRSELQLYVQNTWKLVFKGLNKLSLDQTHSQKQLSARVSQVFQGTATKIQEQDRSNTRNKYLLSSRTKAQEV